MKFLIPLTILVVSYLIYSLFYTPKEPKKGDFIEVDTSTKEYKNPHKKQNQYAPYIPPSTTLSPTIVKEPSIKQTKPDEKEISKEYMTLDDLKQKMPKPKKVPMNRPFNYEVFLQFKRVLQQSSSTYYAKRSIVLNSYISSILTSNHSRERFKELLMSDFGLDEMTIEEQYHKNKTVWDWVLFLAP